MTQQVLNLLHSNGITDVRISGQDYVVRCLNPDHEDRNPSMRINNTTGAFHCLSCGFKGNLFKHYNETIDFLDLRRSKVIGSIAAKFQEIKGLTIPSSALPFNRSWRGISKETYECFDAFTSAEFPNRVVFPILDYSGLVRVYHARLLDGFDGPKYLNHPAKVPMPLFPLVKPVNRSVILVEGFFDMLNLHDKGIKNAVCIFGALTFNKAKLDSIKILGVDTIYLCLDNDEAGNKASEKIKTLAETSFMQTKTIKLPSNINDPGELSLAQVTKLRSNLYGE